MMKLDKIIIYLVIVILIFGFLLTIKPILTPFIVAIVVAYFLDPLADRLVKLHLPRSSSALVILGVFLTTVIAISILILPLLYAQFISFVNAIPGYFNVFVTDFYPQIVAFSNGYGLVLKNDLYSYFDTQTVGSVFGFSGNIVGNIMHSGVVLFNVLSLVFITPVLVFYILRDWDLMVSKIDHYLPATYAGNIRKIFKEIDNTLSGYVHGQFNVCLILGAFYAIGLSLVGLNFGFLIGFLTGFLSFIPYIGLFSGVVIGVIVALFQWGFDANNVITVLLIFITGQVLESNFLTPKLVGDKVGLHPVWIIFGLFVFGILFGFIGVLLAMPATAICGVLIKFCALQYKKNFV